MLWRRVVLFTGVCSLPFVLTACGDKPKSDPRTAIPLVRAASIQEAAVQSRSFTGVVVARVQSDLGFRVSGKILDRFVDTGQFVKQGQALLRLDPIDLRLAAHAQQEAVAAALARAQQTADDEARYRGLRGTGAISESSYDQAKAAADAAKAQLRAAQAQAEVARNATRYAELVADADGIVMETLAEPGQVVSAGQVVVRVARAGQREALIQLPETLRPAIGSSAQAALFGQEDILVETKLRQLSDAADRVTRTFDARYVLDGSLAKAPLGATVSIRLPATANLAASSSFSVPISAVFDAGQGPGVWVISGKPAKVSWQSVSVLSIGSETARVSSEIKQGVQIVALGAHLLHEGQEVRLASSASVNEERRP
ncbi:efflux RND transporter periplasmic adaptor subunit [Achromobacter xylosoxidans]